MSRFKSIRQDLLARDAICATGVRAANASSLDLTSESAAISTDLRQIGLLITQAENAIDHAISDGDILEGDADLLRDLLTQSVTSLAEGDLASSVTVLNSACEIFD